MPMTTVSGDPAMPTSTPSTQMAKSHGARATVYPRGQRLLARGAVALDVAQVVRFEERTGHEARRHAEPPRSTRDRQVLHVGGADGRDDAEVDEHEELAEAVVAVGSWSTGVEPTGADRRGADRDQPPRRPRREEESRQRRRRMNDGEGGVAHPRARRRASTPSSETDRRAPRRCRECRRSSRWRSSCRPATRAPRRGRAPSCPS